MLIGGLIMIKNMVVKFFDLERKIVEYILNNLYIVVNSMVGELGRLVNVSSVVVICLCKFIGVSGF